MMRPWHTWALFGLCLAVVLAAMGWISWTVVKLDRAECEARRQAAVEEEVRLALWRMDSALAPLIARESARPYFVYTPFYPADRAYTRMFAQIQSGEVLVPSPLLTQTSPHVLLHFQFDAEKTLTSPQVPAGNMRDLAEAGGYRRHEAIETSRQRLTELGGHIRPDRLRDLLPATQMRSTADLTLPPRRAREPQAPQQASQHAFKGKGRSVQEARARFQQQAQMRKQVLTDNKMAVSDASISEGHMRPIWLGPFLLLARQVTVEGRQYTQGCWLDWPAIQQWLLGEVRDLLPEAGLEPVKSDRQARSARRLASLPACLIPGPVALAAARTASTLSLSLLLAWGCVLVAAAAVAVLLKGTVSLSERRGAFVSAVTHELRTPLTTFQLYTEMLEEGKVTSEDKRRRYLGTLRSEADRLSHLVENVLAYARLERGRKRRRMETVAVSDLLDQISPRLAERAERAGMQLVVKPLDRDQPLRVRADASIVEQILSNLVDNACKYAAGAEDHAIHLSVARKGRYVAISVQDSGPGISKDDRSDLFRPFRKSARDAANSAPGVGLGLSLSRRLAREAGGDLQLDETIKVGSCFVLTLKAGG